MSWLDYHVVDVFTSVAYGGNPLAVVFGADGLSTSQLAAVAGEFNLSETTFPLPPTVAGADYRVRIFTPAKELPFAGHPSVGTGWLLSSLGQVPTGLLRQERGVGIVTVETSASGAELTTTRLGVLPAATQDVYGLVGLSAADADPVLVPGRATSGVGFTFVPVSSPDAVDRADPDAPGLTGAAEVVVVHFSDGVAYARMFGRDVGVREDPATGSAALAMGVWLADIGVARPGSYAYSISQGVAMGRPSELSCVVEVSPDGVATSCRVRGGVVPVASGRIRVPGT